ncbi:MAG: DUF885 domain-containing protein, partial [Phycisphaerales bacterium]|nr:DUF885 domain-containing protein [Phycisphaerales bacterium]
ALLVVSLVLGARASGATAQPTRTAASARSPELLAILDEHMEWLSSRDPISASQRGDLRFNDRVPDVAPEAIERSVGEARDRLAQLNRLDQARLSEPDRVDAELLRWELEGIVHGAPFRGYLMPISARGGPQVWLPQMAAQLPFQGPQDYEDYSTRLERLPVLIEDTIENMRTGMREGIVPPRVTVQGAAEQCFALASQAMRDDPTLSPFYTPFRAMPGSDSSVKRARRAIEEGIMPAFQTLGEFLRDEYIPACRESIGISDLSPSGDPEYGRRYYQFAIREHTTLDLTADEIHEIGLGEVARIQAEMLDVIAASDFRDRHPEHAALEGEALLAAFLASLKSDPRFFHTSEEELLDEFRVICKEIDPELPRLFGRLPRLPYGVRQIPPIFGPASPAAYYYHGSIATGVPGYFMVNTYALDQRPRYDMIALALHEAVPGHHLQIALAQEMEDVHEFRRRVAFTAFTEGWALYAERLGLEMGGLPWPAGRGLYQDPYDDFGRLNFEMWRALRLVVDTGIHAKGWTRQQAIDYMIAHSANSEHDLVTEVDRYIGWPGQALGYKLGELHIRELRARAERELGAAFRLRDFHDVVLGAGGVPLGVLDERVMAWIERTRAQRESQR